MNLFHIMLCNSSAANSKQLWHWEERKNLEAVTEPVTLPHTIPRARPCSQRLKKLHSFIHSPPKQPGFTQPGPAGGNRALLATRLQFWNPCLDPSQVWSCSCFGSNSKHTWGIAPRAPFPCNTWQRGKQAKGKDGRVTASEEIRKNAKPNLRRLQKSPHQNCTHFL